MKSFALKTNNIDIINYLLNNYAYPDTYISIKKFKIYNNIIFHYTGNSENIFISKLSNLFVDVIIKFKEPYLLKKIIKTNYFYFSDNEQEIVFKKCMDYLNNSSTIEHQVRLEHIYIAFLKYISSNKSVILKGFINFRLFNYMKILDYVVDTFVNEFVVDREYKEFINLLRTIQLETKISIVMTTSDLNIALESDYLYILGNKEIVLSGEPLSVVEKDNVLNKLGLELPFMVDLSVKLRDYNVVDKIELDIDRMVDNIWK